MRKKRTTHARIKVQDQEWFRKQFPSAKNDSERFGQIKRKVEDHLKIESFVNRTGEFIYGKRNWKKQKR